MSAPSMRQDASDRSLGELLRDLSAGTAQLIRQEIRLARTETAESLQKLGGGAVMLGIALVLAISASGALVAGLVTLLSAYVFGGRTWLASFVVALVFGVVALVLARRGAGAFSKSALVPDDTKASIQETAQWLKHPTSSAETSK